MATYITTVLFIAVMDIAVMYFHNSGRCCLIHEIVTVTGEYVYIISADHIIMYLDIIMTNDISLFSYLGISSYLASVYLCLGIKFVFTFSLPNFGKFHFSVSTQYVIFTISKKD